MSSKIETFYLQTFKTVGLILGYIAAHAYCLVTQWCLILLQPHEL